MTQSQGGPRASSQGAPGAQGVPVQPGAPAAESVRRASDDSFAALTEPWTPERETSAAWQGWAYFGAAVMILLGLFQALFGLVALVDRSFFAVRTNQLLAITSYSAWGWIHLVLGALALAAGLGIILGGHLWARVLGVAVALLSAVANLGYLKASPVWSLLLITLDVLVIFALTVHGREIDNR
jgi:hypothetical protein